MKEQESSPARCNKSLCYVHSVYRMYLVRVRARMCMLMQAHMQQVDSQVGNPTHPAKNAPPPFQQMQPYNPRQLRKQAVSTLHDQFFHRLLLLFNMQPEPDNLFPVSFCNRESQLPMVLPR